MGLFVATAAIYQPVGATSDRLGTDIRMSAAPTGELDVSPPSHFLVADRVPAGRPVAGQVTVRNQTGSTLSVSVSVDAPLPPFADRLRVRVLADATTVAEGDLAGLVTPSRSWVVESGHETVVTVEAWVAPAGGSFGDLVDVPIRFTTTRAGS